MESSEREIQVWRTALKRAEDRIEQLTSRLENYKKNGASTPSTSPSSLTHQEQQNDDSPTENEPPRATNINDITSRTMTSDNHSSADSMLLDPSRFPACRKLMELTKARQETGVLGNTLTQPPTNPNRQLIQNALKNTAPPQKDVHGHPSTSRDAIYESHNNSNSSVDNQESQFENNSDITVVIPSNDLPENSSSNKRRSANHISYPLNTLSAWSADKNVTSSHSAELRTSTSNSDSPKTFDVHCQPPIIKKVKTESIF